MQSPERIFSGNIVKETMLSLDISINICVWKIWKSVQWPQIAICDYKGLYLKALSIYKSGNWKKRPRMVGQSTFLWPINLNLFCPRNPFSRLGQLAGQAGKHGLKILHGNWNKKEKMFQKTNVTINKQKYVSSVISEACQVSKQYEEHGQSV